MSAPPKKRLAGLPAFELLEEAVHLLRGAPAGVFVAYYAGAVPFVLALLYFWADMSRGALAGGRCAGGALLLAALFVWMKVWQSVFAARLRTELTGGEPPRWAPRRLANVAVEHAALHAPALFFAPLLPLVIIVPEAFGFLQSLTVLADGEAGGLRAAVRRAGRQAALWPLQQRTVQAVWLLFGLAAFINVVTFLVFGPVLLKTFLGIETAFTRGGQWTILNTTFFASAVALAWLCLDPLLKAVYVLRCFYGLSLSTGEDLRVDLRRARQAPGWLGAGLALLLTLSANVAAQDTAPATKPAKAAAVQAPDLSQSIERTLSQPEFAWRLPRDKVESLAKGWLRQIMVDTVEAVKNAIEAVVEFVAKVYRKIKQFLDRWIKPGKDSEDSGSMDWQSGVQLLVFVLLAIVACVLAVLLVRAWRQRSKRPVVLAQAVAAAPDLTDENTTADQLPEDDWLKLARELAGRGELRLAVRAMYLASLAHLGRRELVVIARFKSNRDYELELRRRARAWPELQGAFAENVGSFDRAWYGMHEVNADSLQRFESNVQRIRATGGPAQ
ncbi:MAG: hypothetical protein FD161_1904 [Limisphaerales bacterium]|nr:MAG: hypothetical protein FD161_1904 [Limisphaerales bacterium]KAG0509085.1 MAG: hypothetical protein E1N63_1706 [Limisphaerales bacterium]TXT50792.1 MAG: hypothetical protein FD140_2104 [Limisphaerales bacterium]